MTRGEPDAGLVCCSHCALAGHSAETCNRPEGIAARGGQTIRIYGSPIGWESASRIGVERGARAGGLARHGRDGRRSR